jgi:DnaJ-class molecular chaperone
MSMYQETCGMCQGVGQVQGSPCICCNGTGIEEFAHPPGVGPSAGCQHESPITAADGSTVCDDCGCPLPDDE